MRPLLPAIVAAGLLVAGAATAQAVVSQGVFRIGADAMWAHGVDGSGQAVAIVDQGFTGLAQSIEAGELPPLDQMSTRSFDPANGLDGRDSLNAATEHGVRMAEIVHDVAPGARLVLVNYHSDEQFVQAVQWIAANGIPIASHSNSMLGGPFDGTGPVARAVDAAAQQGVLWVNSSGNFAKRHWRGTAGPDGVALPLAPQANETLSFGIGWSTPGVDAQLSVQRQQEDGSWAEVARSDASHRTPPITVDGGTWQLVVQQVAGAPSPVDVFSRTVGLGSAATAEGSVATPGDAAGSLTVGAATWGDLKVADYSSRGPTEDGRQKPDIVGPTYVTSNPAFPGTGGTSAATPHVAGAAALLRQQLLAAGQPADVAALRAGLVGRARDIEAPGADVASGAGMVRIDFAAPLVKVGVRPGKNPLLSVRATDDGSITAVSITIDGRPFTRQLSPAVQRRVAALGRKGRHRVVVQAEDSSGNVATTTVQTLVRR